MKQVKNFLPFLAIIIFFGSCTKEDEKLAEQNLKQKTALERIQEFNKKLKSPEKNGYEPMSVEDAYWTIEGALNFNYCDPSIEFISTSIDSVKIELELNENGNVNFEKVSIAYNNVLRAMSDHYYKKVQVDTNRKHPISANLSRIGNSSQFYFISKIGVEPEGKFDWFNSDDWWKYGDNLGKCNGYSGNGDAAQQIEGVINNNHLLPEAGTYFTDLEVIYDIHAHNYLNTNDDIANDNYYDYLMFGNNTNNPNFHDCLSPDEMNFYVDGTMDVVGIEKPNGKTAMVINLFGEAIYYNWTYIGHGGDFQYGVKHYYLRPILTIPRF